MRPYKRIWRLTTLTLPRINLPEYMKDKIANAHITMTKIIIGLIMKLGTLRYIWIKPLNSIAPARLINKSSLDLHYLSTPRLA